MFEFILGLFSFFNTSSVDGMHDVAHPALPHRTFTVKTETTKLPRKFSIPWQGHFSAKNFQTPKSKSELSQIKSTLRKTISSLPRNHTKYLKTLEVHNEKNVSRGMANSYKMLINIGTIESQQELAAIFIHEMGHIIDLGKLRGNEKNGISEFWDGKNPIYRNDPSLKFYRISWINAQDKKVGGQDSDFVSGYAKQDPFEDFAEHYVFYRLHGEKFRTMAKKSKKLQQKYDFLKEKVFDGYTFQNNKNLVILPTKPIWDVTLVGYDMRKDLLSKY